MGTRGAFTQAHWIADAKGVRCDRALALFERPVWRRCKSHGFEVAEGAWFRLFLPGYLLPDFFGDCLSLPKNEARIKR